MSVHVGTAHVKQYADNLELLTQQMHPKFGAATTHASYVGDSAQPVSFLGEVAMQQKTARHQDMQPVNVPHEVPWIYPDPFYVMDYIDREDKLKSLVELEGGYAKVFLAANNRKKDDVFIRDILADRRVGKNAETTVPFPTDMILAHGSTGFTVDKQAAVHAKFMEKDIELEDHEIHTAISPALWEGYITDAQVNNIDTSEVRRLVEGGRKSIYFMGMWIHIFNRLPEADDSGNTIRTCPVWLKDKTQFGQWGSMDSNVARNVSKGNTQVDLQDMYGGIRLEDTGVVQALCQES